MTKRLTVLMCALVLVGFAGLAAAEPAPASPAAQPLVHPAFLSQGACQQTALSNVLVSAPVGESECQGWLYGSCDRRADCTGYYCPLGELKACVGGTGAGARGPAAACHRQDGPIPSMKNATASDTERRNRMNIQQFAQQLSEKENPLPLWEALQALCAAEVEHFQDAGFDGWIPWGVKDPPGFVEA